MNSLDNLGEQIRRRLHVPPGLVVLLTVLVLLYGFAGAAEVVWELATSLLAAMVGGGDHEAVTGVLWRTLPLAMAAAGITFTLTNGWLRADCTTSWVWMALIVLFAAVIGNAAHDTVTSHFVAAGPDSLDSSTVVNQEVEPVEVGIAVGDLHASLTSASLASTTIRLGQTTHRLQYKPVVDRESPWHRLNSIDWLAAPDLSRKPGRVDPLYVVPKGPGIYGGVGGAINQLLGYLVDYEPRLFVASIVAGGFVGWRVQRKVAIANAVVSGDFSELSPREIEKLAA